MEENIPIWLWGTANGTHIHVPPDGTKINSNPVHRRHLVNERERQDISRNLDTFRDLEAHVPDIVLSWSLKESLISYQDLEGFFEIGEGKILKRWWKKKTGMMSSYLQALNDKVKCSSPLGKVK